MKIQRKRIYSDNFESINNIHKYNKVSDNENNTDITCTSNTCTHQKSTIININKIDNLTDLISLAEKYNCVSNKEYNGINLRILNNLIEPLYELDKMIGLDEIKNKLINQILYICRGYNSIPCNNASFTM